MALSNSDATGHKPLRVALFGSTGSIGVNTLDVIRRAPHRFRITALAAHRNIDVLGKQLSEFPNATIAIADESAAEHFRRRFGKAEILSGPDGLRELARRGDYDIFIGALTGFAGFAPTLEAIKLGKRIALANKETLVVAGELLTQLAAKTRSEILPIDSEHSAIYQCLVGESKDSIRRIILTASGGPFRTLPLEQFACITPDQALQHPNWKMGRKITIDSATLMNKGLEVIEAKWLFGVPLSKIAVVVHPQSIIHSMVEFMDGSVKGQLGMPDMRLPIQYALTAPERLDISYDTLDLTRTKPLEFYPPDLEKFPALALAHEAGERGGLFPCTLNAANEVAVAGFLNGQIAFTDIPVLVRTMLDAAPPNASDSLGATNETEILRSFERIMACDAQTRTMASESFASIA